MGNTPNPIVVDFDISEDKVIVPVELEASNTEVGLDVALDIRAVSVKEYEGSYDFIPTSEQQVVEIENKMATANIIIEPIPRNYGLITWNGAVLTVS